MMMRRPYRNLDPVGFLFIGLILLALAAQRFEPFSNVSRTEEPGPGGILFQISGHAPLEGTYFFDYQPDLRELLTVSLKIEFAGSACYLSELEYDYPARLEIIKTDKTWELIRKEIPAYQKMTLGIPISLNRETEEGLTAIPGIGPQTARIIIMERQQRGGFKSVDEIISIKGIGERTFQKMKPFLTL